MNFPIRVLIVEDSSFMRSALARRITSNPRFVVIDTACDGREGVEKALRLKPDVVTMDVEMPIMNGIEALKSIVAQTSIPVVMLSAVTESGARVTLEALALGAVDFIPKSRGAELIHDKLLAAVSSNMRARVPRQAEKLAAPPPPPPAVARSSSKSIKPRLVVIGSSTGGPQALHQVIRQLPAHIPVPVVVAQHMPAQFTLALAKRLDESCPPKVVEAKSGDRLQPGVVYISPGGSHTRVGHGTIEVAPDRGESLYRPSVDVLAQSALAHVGKDVLAVMLTGMGNDGAKEFERIYRAGGYTVAQDQATSVVWGMPRAVVELKAADEVQPLERIGDRVRALLNC